MTNHKAYFNWSTGKDSALALYHVLTEKKLNVEFLLTSVNAHHDRVSMHGLRRSLALKQIEAIGIPWTTIELPEQPGMDEYEMIMRNCVTGLKDNGFTNAVFGDIFLEDLRAYREKQLAPFGIKAHFPLWKKDTKKLMHEFVTMGFKAIVVCIKADALDKSFCGRVIDEQFIHDLPSTVDPCGENGEFHTFCFDAPMFRHPVKFTRGDLIYKEYTAPGDEKNEPKSMGFWFCDLLP